MNKIKILFITDKEYELKIMPLVFKAYSIYDITCINSTALACDLIKQHYFDIFLVSFGMQELNGLEFLKIVKDFYAHIPYIAILCHHNGEVIKVKKKNKNKLYSFTLMTPFCIKDLKTIIRDSAVNLQLLHMQKGQHESRYTA